MRLSPLEPLRRQLVRCKAARSGGEATSDDDSLFPVPRLVVRHNPGTNKKTRLRNGLINTLQVEYMLK